MRGFEPPRIAPYAPEAYAYTNSATYPIFVFNNLHNSNTLPYRVRLQRVLQTQYTFHILITKYSRSCEVTPVTSHAYTNSATYPNASALGKISHLWETHGFPNPSSTGKQMFSRPLSCSILTKVKNTDVFCALGKNRTYITGLEVRCSIH